MSGRTTAYPLLMQDDTLLGEIESRLQQPGTRDNPEYRALRDAILAVPSDTAPTIQINLEDLSSTFGGVLDTEGQR